MIYNKNSDNTCTSCSIKCSEFDLLPELRLPDFKSVLNINSTRGWAAMTDSVGTSPASAAAEMDPPAFPRISRVVFSDPATTVFFGDGTKVTVKASKNDTFDRERGIVYAIVKRLFGTPDPANPNTIVGDGLGAKLNKIVAEGYDQKVGCKVKDIDPATGAPKAKPKPVQPAKASSKRRSFKSRIMDVLEKIATAVETK